MPEQGLARAEEALVGSARRSHQNAGLAVGRMCPSWIGVEEDLVVASQRVWLVAPVRRAPSDLAVREGS